MTRYALHIEADAPGKLAEAIVELDSSFFRPIRAREGTFAGSHEVEAVARAREAILGLGRYARR